MPEKVNKSNGTNISFGETIWPAADKMRNNIGEKGLAGVGEV